MQRVSSVGQPRLTQSNIDENSLSFLWRSLVSSSYATESLQMLTDVAHPSLNSRDFVVILSKTGLPLTGGSWRRSPTNSTFLTQTTHYHQTALPIVGAATAHVRLSDGQILATKALIASIRNDLPVPPTPLTNIQSGLKSQ